MKVHNVSTLDLKYVRDRITEEKLPPLRKQIESQAQQGKVPSEGLRQTIAMFEEQVAQIDAELARRAKENL